MKKILSFVAALFLLAGAAFAEELTIATFKGNSQFAPAVTSILKSAGYDVKVKVYDDQPDIIPVLAKGEADLVFFLAQPVIAQAKGATFITARLMNTDFVAVTTDPSVQIKSSADLKKYKVGIVKDQPGHVAATRGVTNIVEAPNEVAEFKLLQSGAVQVIISVRDLVVPMSQASGLKGAIVSEPPVMKTPTYIALSAKASSKKAALDKLFQDALNDGTWGKELAKISK